MSGAAAPRTAPERTPIWCGARPRPSSKSVPEGRVRGRSAAGRGRSTGPTWWRAARNGGFFREIPVRFTIRGHAGDVYTTPSSPDSRWLASGGWDKPVRLYDAGTGEPCATLPHPGVVHDLAYGPDGRCLTICGRDRPFACGRSTAGRARCSAGTPTRSSRPPFTPTAGARPRRGRLAVGPGAGRGCGAAAWSHELRLVSGLQPRRRDAGVRLRRLHGPPVGHRTAERL